MKKTVRRHRCACSPACTRRPKTRRARYARGHDARVAYAALGRLTRALDMKRIEWGRPGADLRAAYAARRMLEALG